MTRLFLRALALAVADTELSCDDFMIWESRWVPPRRGQDGTYYSPEMKVPLTESLLSWDELQEANAHLDCHRIVVLHEPDLGEDDLALARLVGRIRHEVRHVEQWEWLPLALRLQWVALQTLPAREETAKRSPVELDANGAAAELLRARFGHEVLDAMRATSDRRMADSSAHRLELDSLHNAMFDFIRDNGPTSETLALIRELVKAL
jgi:hypothetical protein